MKGRRLLGAGFAVALIAGLTPLANLDLSWHLSAGRFIVAHRAVPSADFLSWTAAGRPWIDFEWGFEVLARALDAAGGAAALWLFKAAAFAGLLALFAGFLRLRELPDSWIGLALPPFALSLAPFWDMRPELFTFLFCLAQLCVLEARRVGKLRAAPAPLLLLHAGFYALWVNLHAGYPLGLALCLLYGAGEAADGRRDGLWLGLAAAGGLGCLVNPYGPRIFSIFLRHWELAPLLRERIVDWGPPDALSLPRWTGAALLAFSAAAFGLAVLRRRRPPYAHVLAASFFAVLALGFDRQVPYVSLISFPLALLSLHALTPPPWWPRRRAYALAAAFVFVAATGAALLRDQGLFGGVDGTHARELAPACRFLRENESALAPLRLYNGPHSGGALGLALYPDYKVFMDGRYLFTGLLAEIKSAAADPRDWQAFMRAKGIGAVILDYQLRFLVSDKVAGTFVWRPADVYALPRREWALVYWDGTARIWVRRELAPPAWLKDHEFRFLHPRDLPFLSAGVRGGAIALSQVLPEVERYERQIGDREETGRLLEWVREMRR